MAGEPRAEANASATPFRWTAGRVSIMLTIVALVLWSYSITQARFEIGFYGLIGGLPVAFFVSLGILTFASAILWVSKENHGMLLSLQLCLFIAAIWLAPIIVGGAQPFASDAYGDLGYIEYITRNGHLDPEAVWQHNWPVAWIFWAVLLRVFGISINGFASLIPWIPFLWQLMLLLPLFLFFRNTIGRERVNYCFVAMWLFYLGNWFETQNTGGQAFGVFFFFSILAVLTMSSVVRRAFTPVGHSLSAIAILAVSAVAHLLGSLVTLAAVAGLALSRRAKVPNLVLLGVLFVAAWSVFGAMSYFEWRLPALWEAGLRLDLATEKGVLNPLSGSESRAAVALVRILFSGLVLALAIVGGLVGWKLRNNRYADVTVLAIVAACGLVAVAVGAGYAHELYQRFFTFLLPAIAYFGVKALMLKPARIALIVVLLAALPLTFIAKYGNQVIDYLSPGYLTAVNSFHEQTTEGYVTAATPLGRMKNYESYSFRVTYEDLGFMDHGYVPVGDADRPMPTYICLSDHDRAIYTFYYNRVAFMEELEVSLDSATNCNLVYTSPSMQIYVYEDG